MTAERDDQALDAALAAHGSLLDEVAALLGERRGTLAANLVSFARLLKLADFDVTSGRVIDAGRALAAIDLSRAGDVRQALRAVFSSSHEQAPLFDLLFDRYWRQGARRAGAVAAHARTSSAPRRPEQRGRGQVAVTARPAMQPEGDNPTRTSNSADLLTSKDFSTYTAEDIARGRRIMRQIAPKLATALSRRQRAARGGGTIDLRRSLRHSVKHGGEVVELLHRRRRVRNLRLVLLCDVSGSMDVYARFLVQFLYAMQNELRGVSTFVFSTRLHEATHLLKTRSFDEALARLSADVDFWSGGTSIGGSLAAFERHYARRRVDSRTVIVIISDGWERGDPAVLVRAMQALRRRARTIIWLNPLLGSRDYQPLVKGMAAALPYVDEFLPAHNLDSLTRLGRRLVSLAHR